MNMTAIISAALLALITLTGCSQSEPPDQTPAAAPETPYQAPEDQAPGSTPETMPGESAPGQTEETSPTTPAEPPPG